MAILLPAVGVGVGAWLRAKGTAGTAAQAKLQKSEPAAMELLNRLAPAQSDAPGTVHTQQWASLRTPEGLRALANAFRSASGEKRRALAQVMGQTGESSFAELLATLLETGDDSDALVAVRALGAIGGETSTQKLTLLMNDDGWPDALRTEAAQQLLKNGNDANALAAVRGLVEIGGDGSVGTLAEVIDRADAPESLRLEAALGLGVIGSPRAGEELLAAFPQFSAQEVQAQLLNSLGRFPFPQFESFWRQFMNSPGTPGELRAAAAEALANSSAEAVPYLQDLAASERDANVREMAAWALSAHGPNGGLGLALAEMTRAESQPDVRRRLYEAMLAQAENPAEVLLARIESETDPAARVAGFNAVGDAVRRANSSALGSRFDTKIVPELIHIALSPGSLNLRMRAVFALRRASSPASLAALADIAKAESPQIAQAAINGLPQAQKEP